MCTLKELTAHAVERAGSRHDVAKMLGVSETELSYWCNQDNARYIPIDHLVDLDAHAGDLFLKDWAAKRGYDLTPRWSPEKSRTNIFRIIGQFSRAGGELDCTALEAAADNHITPTETRQIRECIRPVKDSIEALEHVIA